jgi:hypothetical protein
LQAAEGKNVESTLARTNERAGAPSGAATTAAAVPA